MELICVARKPLIGTVAANVLEHGTGALNVDGCRVETAEVNPTIARRAGATSHLSTESAADSEARGKIKDRRSAEGYAMVRPGDHLGRWPANVVHDGSEEVVRAFPDTGLSSGGKGAASQKTALAGHVYGTYSGATLGENAGGLGDSGSAARFFYSAKADAADRLESKHPTVKPVDLMRWLVRLVTPPGGLVLDPFAGSGTTGMACMAEGLDCLMIEREAQYVADIRRRLAHVHGTDTPLFSRPSP
jgi:site-specific DNA-methyltransferase (adenine-specific)